MIDPGTKTEGEAFEAYCKRRWGGSGWTSHLRSEGRKDGADFKDWKWWPNTLKAHQLMKYASDKYQIDTTTSKQALFEALYEEGENISLVDTLVDSVGTNKLGLPEPEDLRSYLEEGKGVSEIKREIDTGRRQYNIRGVPFFVISGEASPKPYGLSGAQQSDTFLELFREVSGEEEHNEEE